MELIREGRWEEAYTHGRSGRGLDLSGADLSEVNLEGIDLYGADLTGANLSGANLAEADLTNAILSKANLKGANIEGAELWNAVLPEGFLARSTLVSQLPFRGTPYGYILVSSPRGESLVWSPESWTTPPLVGDP